ncbi:MAG TPA: hypothetical protein VFT16_02265 [Candidatus Saccharimonadales bacterium]|nr:hypothetical protein [Candidatus Saccharimonadales bacterium]
MIRPIRRFYRTHKTRTTVAIVFAAFALLIGVIGYNAPPAISLSDNSITTGYRTDDKSVVLAGKISTLHSPKLLINSNQVPVDASGNFNYRLALKEGDTSITIVAKSDKGDDTKHFNVHRTTATEFAERKKIAAQRKRAAEEEMARVRAAAIKAMPICDGVSVTSNCRADGAVYRIYLYHPAVPAKTHQETETTYKEKITGYCTLCADGTYSPSCATGRGACSWHGGVAQWNAPIKSSVPVYSSKLVVDAPAKEAYYDKVLDKQFE